jgi:quercetin 2,3-dioxygenase
LGKIGKFSGRTDASYLPQNPVHTCFVFVIEGTFEVQNRLVYSKDGILLPEAGEVEFEALSNDGILIIFEL